MESLQCLEAFPDRVISTEMCYPTRETILNQTNEMLASHPDIKDVYIATDDVNVYAQLVLTFDPKVQGSYNKSLLIKHDPDYGTSIESRETSSGSGDPC